MPLAALVLAGCNDGPDPTISLYKQCLAVGGSFHYDGDYGSYSCDMPKAKS